MDSELVGPGVPIGSAARRATRADVALLRRTRLRALADSPAAFGSTLERELARPEAQWRAWIDEPAASFLVDPPDAAPGAKAIGMVAASPHDRRADSIFMAAMWVDAAHRGTGVADCLVEALVAWAEVDRGMTVVTRVMEGNDVARRLYERHGFSLTGGRSGPDSLGRFELDMTRTRSLGIDTTRRSRR